MRQCGIASNDARIRGQVLHSDCGGLDFCIHLLCHRDSLLASGGHMPSPQDLVYKQAFDQMIKAGFGNRDAETAGAEAVRLWRRNTKAVDAIQTAVAKQKKIGIKR
jgi:hypothetical protein